MGKKPENDSASNRKSLRELPLAKLKFLAKKYGVKVKGYTEEGLFGSSTYAP